jgi:hypothetical protein
MPSDRILVLASSRKHGGRCIAGLSLESNTLVRPVSPYDTGELVPGDCLPGNAYPEELDVVTFGHVGHDGDSTQPENLVIDEEPWEVQPRLTAAQVLAKLETVTHDGARLFGNRGKAVHVDDTAGGVDASLLVIEPDDLTLCVTDERRPRAHFKHRGDFYDLAISDLEIAPRLRRRQHEGTYDFMDLGLDEPDRVFLTLSLALPMNDFHSKLVAGIIRM